MSTGSLRSSDQHVAEKPIDAIESALPAPGVLGHSTSAAAAYSLAAVLWQIANRRALTGRLCREAELSPSGTDFAALSSRSPPRFSACSAGSPCECRSPTR